MSAFLAAKRKEDLTRQEVLDDVVRMAYDNQVEGGHLGKRLIDGIKRPFEASVDGALKKSVNSSLGLLGNVTKGALKDDDMPEPVQVALLSFFETVWSQYSRTVEEEIFETQSLERAEHRRSLATQWAEWRWFWPSNSCCPQPWAWFRAVVLYHLMPADSSFWQVVRSPYFFAVALAQVVPFYGIGIYVFCIIFIMINKTDEFQLVRFITGYKAIQFIACGVVPAVLTSFEHYHCLTFIQRGEGVLCKGLGDAADTGGLTGSRWAIAAEPLRIGVVWLAFALLVSGYAHGGKAQADALELVRRDASDGTIDGDQLAAGQTAAPQGFSPSLASTHKAYVLALKALGAEKTSARAGGLLPVFMIYDIVVTLLTFGIAIGLCLSSLTGPAPLTPDNWLFWETMELARGMQALASFPFLLFILPLGLPLLTNNPRPTGYDKQGLLCVALSNTQIRLLRKERKYLSAHVVNAAQVVGGTIKSVSGGTVKFVSGGIKGLVRSTSFDKKEKELV